MRRSGIALFIFCVLSMLAILSAVFPADGVELAGLKLRFPSLQDVLAMEEEEPALDPAVLLEQRRAAARDAAHDNFADFMQHDPARIYFPTRGPEYFDPLFEKLDSAMERPLRIIHYGDSQIEEDRITSGFRKTLQERFGGSGPGYMSLSTQYTLTARSTCSADLPRYSVYGVKSADGGYGPFADFVQLDTTVDVSFSALKRDDADRACFDRLTLLYGGDSLSLNVVCNGVSRRPEARAAINFECFSLADSSLSANLSLDGKADIYGVLLDSDRGVRVDNVAMRGCSGEVFTSIPSEVLGTFFARENVAMVILQYGGNSVPFSTTSKAISSYMSRIRRQLSYLGKVSPDTRILFIGPSDMSTRVNGRMVSYPVLDEFVDSLRNTVVSSGAAYWDLYSAMGGHNSMVRWVNADPPLAGSDHVHFTPAGSEKVSGMLSDTFMLYYEYYRWRKGDD